MTLREAVELWVNRDMTAIPLTVVEKIIKISDYTDIQEITPITTGDQVWSEEHQEVGEVLKTYQDDDGEIFAVVNFNDGLKAEIPIEDLDKEDETSLPMWGTMWTFTVTSDNDWLGDEDNLRKMAECGFRIYESEDYGYIFGIDGAGYSFYDEHWIPLYKARGLQWHDSKK